MHLGAFSVSLAVRDLAASRAFYEALGFSPAGGDETQGWLILRAGQTVIGLFQGMFERNMLTFNPGWAQDCSHTDPFTDVREIATRLAAAGIPAASGNVGDSPTGPAHLVVVDPDGNPILIDQHR